ncbi:MAG: hypothetical protein ACRECO_00260, partial [Xanthobacteraceae bacterium]
MRDQNEADHGELLAGALGAPHERAIILTIRSSRARACLLIFERYCIAAVKRSSEFAAQADQH